MAAKTKTQFGLVVGSSAAAERKGQTMALQLFHEAATRVPAYGDFLKKEKIKSQQIRTISDFEQVTPVDKKNYLTQYSLPELSWDGTLMNSRLISVSSGSSGTSLFWPRGKAQDDEGGWMHERLYQRIFQTNQYDSLVVVCFSMGTWVAGSFTTVSTLGAIDRGARINIVTPGIDQADAVKAIKNLAANYQQIILAGYPPFLKDVIEQAAREGVKWNQHRVRLLFAGEAFGEDWRDYVLDLVGETDPYHSSVNIYGTADAAVLGHETPVSIAARRIIGEDPALTQAIFHTDILPSLLQYYPQRRYFEVADSELIFTARAGIPLVRYNIHDAGGVYSYRELLAPIADRFAKLATDYEITTKDWQLPFVYLSGRKDFTITIYAVNIYPENIKSALIDPKMRSWVTGKFTMATKYYSDMDQYFEINIELAKDITPEAAYHQIAHDTIVTTLRKLNAEYNKLSGAIGAKAEPHIHLLPFGDSDHFGTGVKHRWVHTNGKS
jgi:phenylacetate-coenzyme A ligase PaaK-like adenylate-forming protein